MSVPLRIVPFVGGLLFIALALGIVLPPLFDVLNDPNPVDAPGGAVAVVLMLLFFGAAPAFVGVRLIQRATRGGAGAVATTPQIATTPAIAEAPPTAPALANGATTVDVVDQPPIALASSYEAALPPPPSVRRERKAERTAATAAPLGGPPASSRPARLRAFGRSSLGFAILVGVVTMPLMVLLRPAGANVATVALTIYAIAEIARITIGKSWFISALTSAGTGMMLFIVLAATAGAIEQGEGNNPVLVLPGLLFYAGIGLTGIARLFSRR